MAAFERIITTFTRGELSPRIVPRVDFEGRFDGVEKLDNFIVHVQGGAQKRSGTRFVAAAKVSTGNIRLIPFEYGTTQNYVIEATDSTFRFYTNDGRLESSGSPIEVSTPYSSSDLLDLKWTQNADILFLVHPSFKPRQLRRTDPTTFVLNAPLLKDGPYLDINDTTTTLTINSGSGDAIIDVGTSVTLTASAVTGINNDQGFTSADVDRLVRMKVMPETTAVPDAVWGTPTGSTVTITSAGSNLPLLVEGAKFNVRFSTTNNNGYYTVGAAPTAGSVTATKITGTPEAAAAERVVLDHEPFSWIWLEITAVTNTTTVVATIRGGARAKQDEATINWRLGAFGGDQGWPSVAMFYRSRLWWGRTAGQPQTLWSSIVGNHLNYRPNDLATEVVADDDAITITIDSNQVNAIAWLAGTHRGLLVGTSGETWLVQAPSDSEALSPTNVEAVRQSTWGVDDDLLPATVDTDIVYAQRGRTIIRGASYSLDSDVFTGTNLSILSEHLFHEGVKRLTSVQTPVQTVWTLLEDGHLAGFTYDKEQKVIAWHHHALGKTMAGNSVVRDIAAIKTTQHDQLWLVVARNINGTATRYVEFLEEPFDAQLNTIEEAFFLDCALSYSGAATTAISGLSHLEGETVSILADGSVQPDKTVVGGAITLDRAATEVHVGLMYSAEINTLPLEAPQREGTFVTLGKTKRIHQVTLLLTETVGVKIGPVGGKIDEVLFRDPSVPMDQPIQPFSGIKRLSIEAPWDDSPRIAVLSDQPLPCFVRAIVTESQIHGS